jgi:hypothetical protein
VFSVGVVGALSVFATSTRAAGRAAHLQEAVRIARNEMELAVGEGMTQLQPRNATKGRYTWSRSYVEKPGGLILAEVTVRWTDSGEPQTYRLSEVFAPRR